jgi:uncharacterized membrane protein HdeD (DUF308 family)
VSRPRRSSSAGPGQPATPDDERQTVIPRQGAPGYGGGDEPSAEAGPQGASSAASFDRGLTAGALGFVGPAWPAVLLAALGLLAVGVILLAWPRATLTVVAILLGVALVIGGIFRLVEGFTTRHASGASRAGDVIIGIVAIVAGLFCLRHHDETIFLLAFLLGAFWIVHGVADLAVAATAGPLPGRGFRAIAGLFSIAAGAVVLFWPGISLILLLTVLAAWFLFYGLVLLILAFQLFRVGRGARAAATSPA